MTSPADWVGLILAPVLVLGIVVLVHELGHMLAARWAGVRTLVLSVGMGPVIWKWTHQGTEYRLSALPIGGYVRLAGTGLFEDVTEDTGPGTFRSKSRGVRMGIYLAGPVASILLGFVGLTVALTMGSRFGTGGESQTVAYVMPGSTAALAGFQEGDRIVGGEMAFYTAHDWNGVQWGLYDASGREVRLFVARGDASLELPVVVPAHHPSLYGLGLSMYPVWLAGAGEDAPTIDPATAAAHAASTAVPLREAVVTSTRAVLGGGAMTASIMGDVVTGQGSTDVITGPVGLAWMTASAVKYLGWMSLLELVAIISLGIAFMNLLPIPPLDGGHIAILLVEAIRGRDLSQRTRTVVAVAALLFVLSLLVTVFYVDITRVWR